MGGILQKFVRDVNAVKLSVKYIDQTGDIIRTIDGPGILEQWPVVNLKVASRLKVIDGVNFFAAPIGAFGQFHPGGDNRLPGAGWCQFPELKLHRYQRR